MVDSQLAKLERLARIRLGERVSQVHHNRWTVSVVLTKPGYVAGTEDLFPECHVHPISPVQVGLAWKEEVHEIKQNFG